ncbi:MAG: hypothetical protein IJZ00_02100 [Lachnospiraceae bacterium]|nr:hypothetical protein [Lachnospiraceae bacterium]
MSHIDKLFLKGKMLFQLALHRYILMFFTSYTYLSIIKVDRDLQQISFSVLKSTMIDNPSNIIYIEYNSNIVGIICSNDIKKSAQKGGKNVLINKNYKFLSCKNYYEAKCMFSENPHIHNIPVIVNNRLIGEYSQWDDFIYFSNIQLYKKDSFFQKAFSQVTSIAIVEDKTTVTRYPQLFFEWKQYFINLGVDVISISQYEILETLPTVDYVLFFDEEKKRGLGNYYETLLELYFDRDKCLTFKELIINFTSKRSKQHTHEIIEIILNKLQQRGLHILLLHCDETDTDYNSKFQKDIIQKFNELNMPVTGNIHPKLYEDFFQELYTEEYVQNIMNISFKVKGTLTNLQGRINKLEDCKNDLYNIKDGERLTCFQPSQYDKTIYFFGPCFIVGSCMEDKHTIESFLQKQINTKGFNSIRVVNYGCWSNEYGELSRILETPFQTDDIIVLYISNHTINGIPMLNLYDIIDKHKISAKWVTDSPLHANHKLLEIYANEIYGEISPHFNKQHLTQSKIFTEDISVVNESYIRRYFSDFNSSKYPRIGSIVVNCNPFTKGHRFLIEQALTYVNFLIIFVVEEDKSFFSFPERFAMVSMGVSDLKNVMVVPSGQHILSQETFPNYFGKVISESLIDNVDYDISIFAQQIAPPLNISCRFVGEEPFDIVTNKYNQAMKRILPSHGIDVIEIPRLENNNQIISASLVRKLLIKGDYNTLNQLLPESTKKYLFL